MSLWEKKKKFQMFAWCRLFSLLSLHRCCFSSAPDVFASRNAGKQLFPAFLHPPVEFREAAHETQTAHSELCCHVLLCFWALKATALWRCQDIKLLYIPKKSSEAIMWFMNEVISPTGLHSPRTPGAPKSTRLPVCQRVCAGMYFGNK